MTPALEPGDAGRIVRSPRRRLSPLALLLLSACAPPAPLGPVPHDDDVTSFLRPAPAPPGAPLARASADPAGSLGPEVPYVLEPPAPAGARVATAAASSSAPVTAAAPATTAATRPVDEALRRTARRLAGLPVTAVPDRQRARQEHHDHAVTASFSHFEQRVGEAMLRWSHDTLAAAEGATVFYPFGGPDLVTVRRFYPRASRYVLLALQDGGPPPSLDTLSTSDLDATLDLYAGVFDAFARRGFFITAQMGSGYRTPHMTRGVTGVLLAFAEREGLAVEAIEPVHIGASGVEPVADDRRLADTWSSVRLWLRRTDGTPVELDYLRVDLGDAALARDPDALRLLTSLSAGPTVLKAASHLPQQPGFTRIRDLILDHAPQLVQDETGVAYRRLAPFEVRLFGAFRGVNGLFDGRPQRDLQEAYARGQVSPLPFSVGYRKAAGAALMVATRR